MHLPYRPAWYNWSHCSRSRRGKARLNQRRSAWDLAELLVASFTYYYCDSPKTSSDLSTRVGSYFVSPQQQTAFSSLVEELVPLWRISSLVEANRGLGKLQQLSKLLLDFDPSSNHDWRAYSNVLGTKEVLSTAMPVTVDAIASRLPRDCGCCNPSNYLPPPHAHVFENQDDLRVSPVI